MKWFTIEELCASATALRKGIDNRPDEPVRRNLTALVEDVLDPLRELFGRPVVVNSGYRCAALNRAVGGVAKSQHLRGEAADIRSLENSVRENRRLFETARRSGLPFDQLIDEYGYRWVHISHVRQGVNRRQVLHLGK